ncbi:hypothetical protein STEG23_028641 [Scotinomys teguina]
MGNVAIAADNVEKIENKGPLRLYVRQITCIEECNEMEVTFMSIEGDNTFKPVKATPKHIVFISKNVDRAGKETNLIFVVGNSGPLTAEEHEKLVHFAEEKHIPPENIQDVLATGTRSTRTPSHHKEPGAPGRHHTTRNQEHPDAITPQGTRSTWTPSHHKDSGAPRRHTTTRTQEHSDAITPQVPRSTQTPLQHKPHAGTQEHWTPLD